MDSARPLSKDDSHDEDLETAIQQALATPALKDDPAAQAKAKQVLQEFQFSEELPNAGAARCDPFKIELISHARPWSKLNYPLSYEAELFAEEQIKKWAKNGTIVPSQSAWASPIVVAYHPRSGKPRLCVDYRSLNSLTIGDAYLMPLITDISRSLQGCSVFSKLDLVQGFGQFPVDANSQDYTSFRGVRGGLWKFAACPFGLKNVPAAFQRLMDRVLGSMNWQTASIYIDDCIVFSHSVEEHHGHLAELAERFKRHNIFVRGSKCLFYVADVEYLGYMFNGQTMRVLPSRVQSVLDMQVPKSKEELRSFMGIVGQFRKLIYNYAELATPLEAMKHKNSRTHFDLAVNSPGWTAFQALRLALVGMPALHIPDMSKPFHGYVDASQVAMSFILCQQQQGEEVVIGFFSKAFDKSQLVWSIPVKECHALGYFAKGPCYSFLASGGPHTIYADSVATRSLGKESLKDPKLLRIAMDLAPFPLQIVPISGAKNKSDALTREPFIVPDPAPMAEMHWCSSPIGRSSKVSKVRPMTIEAGA